MLKCKLVIKDEVNCKFEGLDLPTRKSLSSKFKFKIPYAQHIPAVRLGRWDGTVAFFQLGGTTYVNLLTEIIPLLVDAGWEITLEDQRPGHSFQFDTVTEDTFKHICWPNGHPAAGKPIILREDQLQAVNTFLENPQSLQCLATGFGKTIVTAALSYMVEQYGRSIIIVPNKSLVVQTEADYINMGLDVGVFYGDRKETGKTHTICTWQSLHSLFKKSKNADDDSTDQFAIEEFMNDVVCIMIDEAHGIKGDALKSMLTGFMSDVPIRWGMTGTIPKEKFESTALYVSIGHVVNTVAASTLQDQGVLAKCHVQVLQTQEVSVYKTYQTEMQYLLNDKNRLDWMSDKIAKISETGNTLVLVDRIATGKELEKLIPGSVFISGVTKNSARKEQYDDVADADGKILIATFGIAAVGINIPRIFNLILLEPGKSFVRVIQSIGRGIRKAEDKDFVQIYDITSKCKFSKRHLSVRKTFYSDAGYPYDVEKVYI